MKEKTQEILILLIIFGIIFGTFGWLVIGLQKPNLTIPESNNSVPERNYTNYEECKEYCSAIKARSMCYFGCKDLYREQAEEYCNIHGQY